MERRRRVRGGAGVMQPPPLPLSLYRLRQGFLNGFIASNNSKIWVMIMFLLAYASYYYSLTTTPWSTPPIMNDTKDNNNNDRLAYNNKHSLAAAADAAAKSLLLAYRQSFGFFDDLSDEDWKLRQARARNVIQHVHRDNRLQYWHKKYLPRLWYYSNYEPIFSCPHVQRVGGVGDGSKWTCDPHRIKKMALQRSNKNNANNKNADNKCLIYSVGCNGMYKWEDSMIELLGLNICEIHVFDPGNFTRPENARLDIHYHQWGFKSSYDTMTTSTEETMSLTPELNGTYLSFPETLRQLGHENRIMDVLKVDCEYCEWLSYRDWIQYGDVRQLLVETHRLPYFENVHKYWPFPGTNVTPFDFFDDLHAANFILYYKEPNLFAGGNVVEWAFIKLHPDFLNGKR